VGGLAQREVRRRRPGRATAAVRLPRASAGMGRVRAAADGAAGAFPAGAGLEDAPEAATAALAADRETLWKLPRLRELAAGFGAHGLAPLLDEVSDESVAPDEVRPRSTMPGTGRSWTRSGSATDYGAEYGAALDAIAEDLRLRDTEHLAANRPWVRCARPWTGTRCRPG
jgi:hypothetical protein